MRTINVKFLIHFDSMILKLFIKVAEHDKFIFKKVKAIL